MFTLSRALEKALLQHFILYKLEIAYAINKPFPFFESLRDKSFITEGMYRESLEACRNLVPISRVVYNILTKLEKTFNLSLLMTLFGQINLCEYPNLRMILKSFINVSTSYREQSKTAPTPLRAPAGPAEGSTLQTLLQLPPPQPPPLRHPCPTVSEASASLQQIDDSLDKSPSPSGPAAPLPGLILGGGTQVASENLTSKKKEEDPREMPNLPAGTLQVTQDASAEASDPEEPQETCRTSPKKKAPGALCFFLGGAGSFHPLGLTWVPALTKEEKKNETVPQPPVQQGPLAKPRCLSLRLPQSSSCGEDGAARMDWVRLLLPPLLLSQ
ncbi:Interferon-induced protein 75 [Fukomys damarensis]|uniref:Interferon-induced protein 75 n=1 Tax=Fukomys damarensis TaxID=885580 RepID=A0A091CVT2_FUKDA|nr:Interferon-induced protein 75 [Fukomys damarensis]